MPDTSDWRSRIARTDLDHLERPELAAEFLRRNRHYRRDHERLSRSVGKGEVSEGEAQAALGRKWGLSFRD